MNGPLSSQDKEPNVIEEIPSHELYASLVGIPFSSYNNNNNAKSKDHSWSWSDSDIASHYSQRNDSPIIVIPPPITFQECKSEFGKAYKRAGVLEKGVMEPSKLTLNSSNKGFKILEKMGWKESGGGLGKQRQGILTPLKPCLKLDQMGLGCCSKNHKKKKLHRDNSTMSDHVSRAPIQPCQKKRRRRQEEEQKEARTMKRIRLMLRSDLADEYLPYL